VFLVWFMDLLVLLWLLARPLLVIYIVRCWV